jgi:hypothetical protein
MRRLMWQGRARDGLAAEVALAGLPGGSKTLVSLLTAGFVVRLPGDPPRLRLTPNGITRVRAQGRASDAVAALVRPHVVN